jgi:hypothetical protein
MSPYRRQKSSKIFFDQIPTKNTLLALFLNLKMIFMQIGCNLEILEKKSFLEILTHFYLSWTKSNILVKISPQALKFWLVIFKWRIKKNWSSGDLLTLRIQDQEVFVDNVYKYIYSLNQTGDS